MESVGGQKISIVVPVYNTAPYLHECVATLAAQTYKNLEILLVNDGSTDNSGEICDQWAVQDNRITVIHTENRGVSHARNLGIERASGAYISFVDSDDWVDRDYYDSMLKAVLDYGVEACLTGYTEEGDRKRYIGNKTHHPIAGSSTDILRYMVLTEGEKTSFFAIAAKLWKRSLLNDIRLREDIHVGEDSLFSWQVMRQARSAVYFPIYGYHYRQRSDSAIHSIHVEKTFSGIKAFQYICENAKNISEELSKEGQLLYLRYIITVSKQILQSDRRDLIQELEKMVAEIRRNLWLILRARSSSWRIRMGCLYLCMPIKLCYAFRFLLLETGRNICPK